jgi:transposase-like protein
MARNKKYTRDEKLRAVMVMRECKSTTKAEKITGISRSMLSRWDRALREEMKEVEPLPVTEAEVIQRVNDALRDFLEKHYADITTAFKAAIHKTITGLKEQKVTPMAAITIAEKLANIVKMFAIAESSGAANTENLLTMCLNKIEKNKM